MTRNIRNLLLGLAAVAVLIPGAAVEAAQPWDHDVTNEYILDNGTWAEVSAWLKQSKDTVELGEASIIIEVNATDGDAGFQIFLDGDGWRNARVYDSNGVRILKVTVTVPADTTMVTLPEEFLVEGTEFKFEILAIEESGNQTITEGCFETEEE